jgi:ABC-type transport system involved in cytochrome bd biosynthesis fused ATPase/permease subunit
LAHALLAAAPVLMLDEPTAHLDPHTTSELTADAFSAAGEQRVRLITHRTEGLELVDRVLALDRPDGASTNSIREVSKQ